MLSELVTLCLYKLDHETAARTLTAIQDSESIIVLAVDTTTFEAATDQFVEYDDQAISFADHSTAVLAAEREVDHVLRSIRISERLASISLRLILARSDDKKGSTC